MDACKEIDKLRAENAALAARVKELEGRVAAKIHAELQEARKVAALALHVEAMRGALSRAFAAYSFYMDTVHERGGVNLDYLPPRNEENFLEAMDAMETALALSPVPRVEAKHGPGCACADTEEGCPGYRKDAPCFYCGKTMSNHFGTAMQCYVGKVDNTFIPDTRYDAPPDQPREAGKPCQDCLGPGVVACGQCGRCPEHCPNCQEKPE